MKDRNENSPGYKKTKAGWIPKEWECYKGLDITKMIGKGASPKWQGFNYSSSGMLFITSENVRDGYLDINAPKYLPLEFHLKLKRTQIQKGDLLINLVGASIGRSCLVTKDLGPANVNQAVSVFRIREGICREYVAYFFQTSSTINRIIGMQVDAARPNISLTDLRNFFVPLPPLPEQKKVAEILSTWDEAINHTRKVIDTKKRHKKALMQRILTGRNHFQGFGNAAEKRDILPNGWQMVKLKNIFTSINRKNDEGTKRILTASGQYGLIDQTDFFNRSVAGQSMQKYYLLKKGEFAFNRSAMKNYPYGAIKRLNNYDEGILSILYICFALENESCHSDFYEHLFESGILNKQLRRIAQVGGRAHGLLNVTNKDFFSVELPKPSYAEQKRIADVMNVCNTEIETLNKKEAALRKQKKGLMQKLLTGEVRVSV